MTDTANPVLSVRDLSVVFPLRDGEFEASRDVSFDLYPGRTLCLVGESGSGKSVSARALMQLVDRPGRIARGSVTLHGDTDVEITSLSPGSRQIRAIRGRRIGLIFQEPMSALSALHTIGNQIDEVLQLHLGLSNTEARARTVELLRQVEIPNPEQMAKRYSFEFSGGMRQRVCIAMALACNPEVLIADEPTTALDVTTQAEILDLIKRLQDSHGMAVLLITHDMGVVAEVADEVAVMRRGRIVESGPVLDIFRAAKHPYTVRLMSEARKLDGGRPGAVRDTESEPPILKVRGLTKVFGAVKSRFGSGSPGFRAVNDVSFDLHRGENLGIVGESGSGKTTLGRLVLRIMEPSSGKVIYRDPDGVEQNVMAMDRRQLRKYHSAARLVFQDPFGSLNPRMTVRQVVGDPLRINGLARGKALEDRVVELLDMVGLSRSMMDRYPHAFSGGQRQRIGIARALALEPKIIIADEATSALDVSIRSQILDLLLDLQARLDLSFLFISHDIAVVRYFCDRVAVMYQGQLVEIGSAEQICSTPTEAYTKALISAVPSPDPEEKRMMYRSRYVGNEAGTIQ